MRSLLAKISAMCGAAVLISTAACSTDGCLENQSSIPLAGFYSSTDSSMVTLDSLEIAGIGAANDSVLYTAGTKISKAYLPMRAAKDETSWIISYKWKHLDYPELRDTISFGYTSEVYFVSDLCGVIYKYHINKMSYTTHLIDRVVITDSLISNSDRERIKIFFRTSDPDDDFEDYDEIEPEEDEKDSQNAPLQVHAATHYKITIR